MAVDTRDRRMSLIALGLPSGRVLPHVSGSITSGNFEQLMYLYSGIQAGLNIIINSSTLISSYRSFTGSI